MFGYYYLNRHFIERATWEYDYIEVHRGHYYQKNRNHLCPNKDKRFGNPLHNNKQWISMDPLFIKDK